MNSITEEKENLIESINKDLADAIEHGIYVSNMARIMAIELGLSKEEIYKMSLAGMLHDIGKLKLAGYLYGDEDQSVVSQMRHVRTHSRFSYDILKEKGLEEDILMSILHHHENYDGSGYPDNISGEDIPLGARILRVCDVFVALISDRPYRRAFDVKTAVELMIDEVKNFDMKIFLAFQRVVHKVDIEKDIKRVHIHTKDVMCLTFDGITA